MDETGWRSGEAAAYRAARDELLAAEHELSRAAERVAALRRRLPRGAAVIDDYVFSEGPRDINTDEPVAAIRMSDLFEQHQSLLLYSFMFDGTGTPCRMCTSLIDGFEGAAADLAQRVGFAVVAPAPLRELRRYGRDRGWRNVRLVSVADTAYSRDHGGVDENGDLRSTLNVFTRQDGTIRHFYATEKSASGPQEDDRHLDLLWVLWGALDLTPEGRGRNWRPNRPHRR